MLDFLKNECKMPIYLAYAMLTYIGACVYYIVMTRNIGTPFKDSLTEEQMQIKKKSVSVRKNIFMYGCAISVAVLFVLKPFSKCE